MRSFVNMLDRYQKIDDRTVAIRTKSRFSFFPCMIPTILMVSPTQWEKAGRSSWVFVVHDLNPRAMSLKVKGLQPAPSWYQDFTKVTVE